MLSLLLEAVQDYAIIFLGPGGEIRSWNAGARRVMGYPEEEVIGRNFSIFYPAEALAKDKPTEELETAARTGRVEDEGWRIRKDGTKFWANTIITALKKSDGTIAGFAKITRDLTERRTAEEELHRSEEMFRLLVTSVRDYAIFMLDPSGRIVSWNLGAERIMGYTAGEVAGKHFSIFYPEEAIADGKPERELEIARRDGMIEDEGWRIRKNGSRFLADTIITAIHDRAGRLRGFAKVTRDVSERRRAEDLRRDMLEQREARLRAEEAKRVVETSFRAEQEANRAKDDFLMTLSHELLTPLTSILGWARILPTLDPSDETFRVALESISRSAALQSHLLDDVLDTSRIVAGKLRLCIGSADVRKIVQAATDSIRAAVRAKDIDLIVRIDPDVGIIQADSTRLQQVLWNLLSNAAKFTPPRGRIEVAAKRDRSFLVLTVRDTGEGIAPEFLVHLFDAFSQAESPPTRSHGGLGLGLSIVRYLVEAHGGRVSASSPGQGKGATFTIRIPLVEAGQDGGEDGSGEEGDETQRLPRRRSR